MSLLPPVQRRFGRYVLLCRFASGGMANLFLARFAGPGGFNKLVAIKRIHEHLTEDEDFVNMFVDEARLAARIEHPNVVQVIELGAVDSAFFIAMEYVAGESLIALLRRTAPPMELSARIISQAALGLHAAHELRDTKGELLHVVHRDVSPGNILVSYQGVVKVADFGVARARTNIHTTNAGTVKGKFAYMAPEQARSGPVDRRADVFALGIVLYEITTRRRLFKADSDMVTMAKVLNEPITPPSKIVDDYPPALERVVMRALQRERDRRYQSADALHEALEEYIRESGTPALQSSLGELMARVFQDRIADKELFLRRSEEELADEIADLPQTETPSATSFRLDGTASAVRWLRRRRQVVRAFVAAGITIVALLVAGYALLSGSSETGADPVAGQVSFENPAGQPAAPAVVAVDEHASAKVAPAPVRILVKVIPDSATVTFDGEPVSNPHRVEVSGRTGRAQVVASAPGYATRRFDVPLSESSRWVIALDRRRPAATALASPAGSEPTHVATKATAAASSKVVNKADAAKISKARRQTAPRRRATARQSSRRKSPRLLDNPY